MRISKAVDDGTLVADEQHSFQGEAEENSTSRSRRNEPLVDESKATGAARSATRLGSKFAMDNAVQAAYARGHKSGLKASRRERLDSANASRGSDADLASLYREEISLSTVHRAGNRRYDVGRKKTLEMAIKNAWTPSSNAADIQMQPQTFTRPPVEAQPMTNEPEGAHQHGWVQQHFGPQPFGAWM